MSARANWGHRGSYLLLTCFSILLTKLRLTTTNFFGEWQKRDNVSNKNKSSSLASNSNSRPSDSPESARVTQMLTDRCFYLLSKRKEQTETDRGLMDVPGAHVCICRTTAATVRIRRATEFHEQPLFRHRATNKQSRECARACLPESTARVYR